MENQFINYINLELKHNKIAEYFQSLKGCVELKSDYEPVLLTHFKVLDFYYSWGYKHFENIEWGFIDINKVDYKTKLVTKPYGKLFKSIYDLAKESHALQDSNNISNPYPNTYRWFISIILELMLYDLEYMLQENRDNDVIVMWKERVKCFKSLNSPTKNTLNYNIDYNPFIQNITEYSTNALLLFIESAYSLSCFNNNFHNKYWQPFISAQEEIIKTLETSPYLDSIKILPVTQEYQIASREKSGKRAKYKSPKPLSKWLK